MTRRHNNRLMSSSGHLKDAMIMINVSCICYYNDINMISRFEVNTFLGMVGTFGMR